MPRISKQLSDEKKNFVRTLLRADPAMSSSAVTARVKEQFGASINPDTIANIRIELAIQPRMNASTEAPAAEAAPVQTTPETAVSTESPVSTTEAVVEAAPPTPAELEGEAVVAAVPKRTAPKPLVVPEEGVTYVEQGGYVQVTDANGISVIRKAPVATEPAVEAN